MKKLKPFLSIIIPVYNEAKRLHNLQKIIDYLKAKSFSSELIVVDDGSIDNTSYLLQTFSNKFVMRVISLKKNEGKGSAIKKGMLAAKGAWRVFTDIDLSIPIENFDSFRSYMKKYPVILGSRRVPGAVIAIHQPILRELMGRFFSALSRIILGLSIADFTCGFKCFSQEAAKMIFSRTTIDRWGVDSEVLFIAKTLKLPIKEVPITWRNDPSTKVRFPQDAINSFFELLIIRLNDLRGLYKKHVHRTT